MFFLFVYVKEIMLHCITKQYEKTLSFKKDILHGNTTNFDNLSSNVPMLFYVC